MTRLERAQKRQNAAYSNLSSSAAIYFFLRKHFEVAMRNFDLAQERVRKANKELDSIKEKK